MIDTTTDTHTTSLQGRTVLLVDDDSNNVFATKMLLDKQGITVITAGNGQEAINKLEADEASKIELVLMDVMMPIMDGLTATRLLRKNSRFATLPIITLTGKSLKSDRDECMAAGASDYLAKPFTASSLYKVLESWFWFVDKE